VAERFVGTRRNEVKRVPYDQNLQTFLTSLTVESATEELVRDELEGASWIIFSGEDDVARILRVDADEVVIYQVGHVSAPAKIDLLSGLKWDWVKTWRLGRPRGAQVFEERRIAGNVVTETLIAEHPSLPALDPSLPAGALKFKCSDLEGEALESLRKILSSWAAPEES
jgi:hypothetical protein